MMPAAKASSKRPYESREYQASERYSMMVFETEFPYCWFCGRGSSYMDKPNFWTAPWRIERAHIVNKPRREDRRAVVLACSLCHRIQHGDRFAIVNEAFLITKANMLWIKQHADPEWYDPKFLRACSVGNLPEPEEPCNAVSDLFRARRRTWWKPERVATVATHQEIIITIPVPDECLSPNSRAHFFKVAKAKETAKSFAYHATREITGGIELKWKTAFVESTYFHRLARKRDGDNYLARLKSTFDGLQVAGLIVNDSGLTYAPVQFKKGAPDAKDKVEIKITRTS